MFVVDQQERHLLPSVAVRVQYLTSIIQGCPQTSTHNGYETLASRYTHKTHMHRINELIKKYFYFFNDRSIGVSICVVECSDHKCQKRVLAFREL